MFLAVSMPITSLTLTLSRHGETVTGSHYQVAFGGKGANQAVAAGRSGANIAFIACTGDDDIGESVRKQLAKDNIDIAPISVISGNRPVLR